MDKAEIARRQLGTALHLFINDLDPVSVHCLASGGAEIAASLATDGEGKSFATYFLEEYHDKNIKDYVKIRNQYWNSFKHINTHNGSKRSDKKLIEKFSDEMNIDQLFIGWHDLWIAIRKMPVEAQLFQIWTRSRHIEKVKDKNEFNVYQKVFPDINTLDLKEQKKHLVYKIEYYRKNLELMSNPTTDARPLILQM